MVSEGAVHCAVVETSEVPRPEENKVVCVYMSVCVCISVCMYGFVLVCVWMIYVYISPRKPDVTGKPRLWIKKYKEHLQEDILNTVLPFSPSAGFIEKEERMK